MNVIIMYGDYIKHSGRLVDDEHNIIIMNTWTLLNPGCGGCLSVVVKCAAKRKRQVATVNLKKWKLTNTENSEVSNNHPVHPPSSILIVGIESHMTKTGLLTRGSELQPKLSTRQH